MHLIDLAIIVAYLAGTVVFGAWFSRSQKDVKDYFVGGRNVPWWAIMGSIVATETSTVTFISVPGVAFTGNWTFLQLVMGYMVGRIVVSIIFVPAYFRGELLTVYQILGRALRRGREAAGGRALPRHAKPRGRRPAVCHGPRAGGAPDRHARHGRDGEGLGPGPGSGADDSAGVRGGHGPHDDRLHVPRRHEPRSSGPT